MITAEFDYHAPRTVPEALKLLSSLGDDAKLLAGGHSLLPMMKLRFAAPSHLIDLGKIPTLRGITQVGNEIHIGAMTTEHELLHSKLLADKVPLLVEGAGWIADPQIRYKGTIGGVMRVEIRAPTGVKARTGIIIPMRSASASIPIATIRRFITS